MDNEFTLSTTLLEYHGVTKTIGFERETPKDLSTRKYKRETPNEDITKSLSQRISSQYLSPKEWQQTVFSRKGDTTYWYHKTNTKQENRCLYIGAW